MVVDMKVILVAASLVLAGVFGAEPTATTYLTPEEAEKAVSMTGIGEWAKGVRDEDKAEDSDRKAKFDKCVDKFTVVYKVTRAKLFLNPELQCAESIFSLTHFFFFLFHLK
jgi:hypothetical protein